MGLRSTTLHRTPVNSKASVLVKSATAMCVGENGPFGTSPNAPPRAVIAANSAPPARPVCLSRFGCTGQRVETAHVKPYQVAPLREIRLQGGLAGAQRQQMNDGPDGAEVFTNGGGQCFHMCRIGQVGDNHVARGDGRIRAVAQEKGAFAVALQLVGERGSDTGFVVGDQADASGMVFRSSRTKCAACPPWSG